MLKNRKQWARKASQREDRERKLQRLGVKNKRRCVCAHRCARTKVRFGGYVYAYSCAITRSANSKHRRDRTRGTTNNANRDEIHHETGDVLLMVTVGDPGWAGCTMRPHRSVGPVFDLFLSVFSFWPLPILLTIILCRHAVSRESKWADFLLRNTSTERVGPIGGIRRGAVSAFSNKFIYKSNRIINVHRFKWFAKWD